MQQLSGAVIAGLLLGSICACFAPWLRCLGYFSRKRRRPNKPKVFEIRICGNVLTRVTITRTGLGTTFPGIYAVCFGLFYIPVNLLRHRSIETPYLTICFGLAYLIGVWATEAAMRWRRRDPNG